MAHDAVCSPLASAWTRITQSPLPVLAALCLLSDPLWAAGTTAGTLIENTARVDFDVSGTSVSVNSNTVSLNVDERIDVLVTPLTTQTLVAPGDEDRGLLFRVTNLGNGAELFSFSFDSILAGDDFDPVPNVPAIFFDTDASGDFSLGDVAYVPGGNDRLLAPDESVDVLLVNDIPSGVSNGQVGRSELTAIAATGNGSPGDEFPNLGDGGVDAVLGTSGGLSAAIADYVVADVQLEILKSVLVSDPFGGNEPVPGATLTYTVTIAVTNGGTATNSIFADPIPANTSFVVSSITLNGNSLSDAAGDDAGEFDTTGVPTVVVRLGDLTQSSVLQTVSFDVIID